MRRFCAIVGIVMFCGLGFFSQVQAVCNEQDTDHVPTILQGKVYCSGGENPFDVKVTCFRGDGEDCPHFVFNFDAADDQYVFTFYKEITDSYPIMVCFEGKCGSATRSTILTFTYPAFSSPQNQDIVLGGFAVPTPIFTPIPGVPSWITIMDIAGTFDIVDEGSFENVRRILGESGSIGTEILDRYELHVDEIAMLLVEYSDLRTSMFHLVNEFMPALRALKKTETPVQKKITRLDVIKIIELFDDFHAKASPELKKSIEYLKPVMLSLRELTVEQAFERLKTVKQASPELQSR